MDTVLWLCPSLPTETLRWLSPLPILMQESFWWWQCSDRYIISLSPHLHTPFPPFSPSLISLMVSVDVKHHVYLVTVQYWVSAEFIFQKVWGGGGGYQEGPIPETEWFWIGMRTVWATLLFLQFMVGGGGDDKMVKSCCTTLCCVVLQSVLPWLGIHVWPGAQQHAAHNVCRSVSVFHWE